MNLEWEQEKPKDNVLTGTVGAFLGSLIGVACIVLVDRLGYVSALCGVVMAVCSIKGYALLGGRASKRGAVISGLMILIMTYIANRLCFSLAVLELVSDQGIGFFEVYQKLPRLLEDREIWEVYLRALVMLYLFTLLGGVPTLIGAFREPVKRPAYSVPIEDYPELHGEFYALKKDWMKPLRLSVCVPGLVLMAAVLLMWTASPMLIGDAATYPLIGFGSLSILLTFGLMLPAITLCNSPHILFVRAGGKLWRVDLQKFCHVADWTLQDAGKKRAIQYDILQEIDCRLDGPTYNYSSGALEELKDLQVEKEDKWSWTVTYERETGGRKRLKIGKGYPDFSPAPGMERAQGPVPCRWLAAAIFLPLTAALVASGIVLGLRMERIEPDVPENPGEEVKAEVKSVPARVPESVTEFEMSEVWFKMDKTFQYSRRTFLDGETGTSYRAYVQYGVDESDAWDTLTQYISEYRASPLYDRFDAVYLDSDPLAPLDGTSKYNIVSVYLTDGQVLHTAAVLSEDGALFTIEAKHDSSVQSVEEVLANLMFTLESVRFEGPAVSAENYQSQIHISEIRDCAYMAAAYLRTDLFGHDAYVDVYVPYSETPIYSTDGRSIRTETHGLRVYVTILPGKNAKDVIEARHQELAATGQIYEEGVVDEEYREDLDAACKLTTYKENGQDRYAVLYADSKWEGYYLLREITGLPELVDEEYPALLTELEGIIGLTMPILENLGGAT